MLARLTPEIRHIAERLREVVDGALPAAEEGIFGGEKTVIALYTLGDGHHPVCAIQPATNHCKLYVHRVGADDSPDLLLEGKGRANRHIKFHGIEQVDPLPIRALLDLSVARVN